MIKIITDVTCVCKHRTSCKCMWLYSNFNMSILEAESYHSGHLLLLLLTGDSQVKTYLPYGSKQDLQIIIITIL